MDWLSNYGACRMAGGLSMLAQRSAGGHPVGCGKMDVSGDQVLALYRDGKVQEINELVVEQMADRYRSQLPLLPGAVEAVERIAARWPLGVASSSNRALINLVLELSGLAPKFRATVSSEEVARGKPAPDVYLEAVRRLGVDPARAAAVEDSDSGIRSASAAGMRVVAIPNRSFPPSGEALGLAYAVLDSLADLTPEAIEP